MNNDENIITAIGPGVAEDRLPTGRSQIEGFDDYRYVEVFNPLPVDFVGQVGLTKTVSAKMPIGGSDDPNSPNVTKTEQDMRQTYGLDLRANAQQQGKIHLPNKVRIPSGRSLRLFGSEAQVIVMQLVTAIIQQEGGSIADPARRQAAEERVIRSTGSIRETMVSPQSERDQLRAALDQMNDNTIQHQEAPSGEAEFAALSAATAGPDSGQGDPGQPAPDEPRKRTGRPPRAA